MFKTTLLLPLLGVLLGVCPLAARAQMAPATPSAAVSEATVPEQIAPPLSSEDDRLHAELARARQLWSMRDFGGAESAFARAVVLARAARDEASLAAAAEGVGACAIAQGHQADAATADSLVLALERYRQLSDASGQARVEAALRQIGHAIPPRPSPVATAPTPAPVAAPTPPPAAPAPPPKHEASPPDEPKGPSWTDHFGIGAGPYGITRYSFSLTRIVPDAPEELENRGWLFQMKFNIPVLHYFSFGLEGGHDNSGRWQYAVEGTLHINFRAGPFGLGFGSGIRYDGLTTGDTGTYGQPGGPVVPAYATFRVQAGDVVALLFTTRLTWALTDERKTQIGYPFLDEWKFHPNEAWAEAAMDFGGYIELSYRYSRIAKGLQHGVYLTFAVPDLN
ncbi:MAG: hypothetical protein JST92_04360 [Deltaproteobacteria bacterium]|nr:hypothetical protein [Deltaproteobacteria bacterium]